MDRAIAAQRDFSAGQVDVRGLRRDDTDLQRAALRTARNVRLLNGGPAKRRPGRRSLFTSDGGLTERIRPAVGTYFYMTLTGGQAVFRTADRAVAITFTGMPWTSAILAELRFVETNGNVIVAHQSFRPQVFSYNATTGAWTTAPFAFGIAQTGALRQPFRGFYTGANVTLLPSDYSGTISITFSSPVLTAAHIGTFLNYVGRQIEITAVADSQHGTAVVHETLPYSYVLGVDQVKGLGVGDVVQGVTTGCSGFVIGIAPNGQQFSVVVTKNYAGFAVNEKIAGPRASMTCTTSAQTVPQPTTNWEEPLMSPVHGWPGCVFADQQRLGFANFPSYGPGVVWSAIGSLDDFLVGSEANDAIFEYVPENCQVRSVAGFSGDEFILTDTGVFYVPISASNPLKPGSVSFRRISNDGASPVRPQPTTQGLAFVNASLSRILAIVSTGQTAAPYYVDDVSAFHSDLIRSPVTIAVTSSDVKVPERYLYVVNGDGTMAVARYDKSAKWVGWVPWDGLGAVKWVSCAGDEILVDAEYATATGAHRFAEAFDETLLCDGSVVVSGPIVWAAGLTASVVESGWYRGDYDLDGAGNLPDAVPTGGTVTAGFNFQVEIEPFVQDADGGPSRKQRLRRRRITQTGVVVQDSQAFEVGGNLVPFWMAGENEEVAPPLRSGTYRFRRFGRTFDPRWSVRQSIPAPLTLLELITEATI